MNYDFWKLMTPEEDADFRRGSMRPMCECDVCGSAVGHLTRVIAYGIETFACDECLERDPEEEEEGEGC